MPDDSAHNLLFSNDQHGVYPGSWYAASVQQPPVRPPLVGRREFDVVVIGAGFTGLSAALKLSEQGYRVAVVEAHRAGWGASGRNGGQLGSGQRADQDVLEQRYGVTHARQLWQLAQESKQLVARLIATHSIDCDYRSGIIHANHRKRYATATRQYVDLLRSAYDYQQITYIEGESLYEKIGSREYLSASVDTGAGHLHPLKYALGLAAAACRAGAEIFEMSVVDKIDYGKTVNVSTQQGNIEAASLVFACNGYLGGLHRAVASKVMPINNFIIATQPLDESLNRTILPDNMAVADSRFVVNYFRKSADSRLLFGGRESYGYRFPVDIKSYVKQAMVQIYPQLESTGIDHGWGGTLAITMNRMPHIAALAPNVYTASGYSGHGVGMATLSGHLVADAIDGTLKQFDVMAKIKHAMFPGGSSLRSPLMKLGMFYYSLRDKL
ncbi:MAG: FAD-binding oxidoreductase [Pseudomonadota bacterium]